MEKTEESDEKQIMISEMSTKEELLSVSMERTREWILSVETPTDMTIHVGETSFSLHKFLLLSKCGYIKKLVPEGDESDPFTIEISELPGGSEGFEYAAKFCYGIDIEMKLGNIAILRCVAEFLEMTDEYAVGNLVSKTEDYITGEALQSLSGAIHILHSCESILLSAEKVKLVSRCIDAIAFFTCRDIILTAPMKVNGDQEGYWWSEPLSILRFDVFQRVLIAMIARGSTQLALGPILIPFARKFIGGLEIYAKVRKKMDPREEQEKRIILETIVSFLPREKNTVSVSFLSLLLKAAMYLETTISCRLCLEKKISSQLEQAVLGDLMIPSYSSDINTKFDIDTVKRIITNFMECGNENYERVIKLMEEYLSDISSDLNLSVSEFIALSELIPRDSRSNDDGIYKAIDIYLEAHPALSDMERKKLCTVMDIQKLTFEAYSRATKNKNLPLQIIVQLLNSNQQQLSDRCSDHHSEPAPVSPYTSDGGLYIQRENHELKMEMMNIKTKVSDTDKKSVSSASSSITSVGTAGKAPIQKKGLIAAAPIKLFPLLRADIAWKPPSKTKAKTPVTKSRRHSMSS